MTEDGWSVAPENDSIPVSDPTDASDKMYDGYMGPSADILPYGMSPLGLFFYFMPKAFWRHVASQSNLYWEQSLDSRVDAVFEKERSSGPRKNPPRSKAAIRASLSRFKKIKPHEVINWLGCMVARVLCPRKRLQMHWASRQDGALPAGTFGGVMSRQRFQDISRFLHFSDNKDPRAKTDRAWKIRPILQVLEKTFKDGYVLGSKIAIDEGMLPSRSRRNPTRTYMKDKPHKWGSKCVMTCCAVTGYCKR